MIHGSVLAWLNINKTCRNLHNFSQYGCFNYKDIENAECII